MVGMVWFFSYFEAVVENNILVCLWDEVGLRVGIFKLLPTFLEPSYLPDGFKSRVRECSANYLLSQRLAITLARQSATKKASGHTQCAWEDMSQRESRPTWNA